MKIAFKYFILFALVLLISSCSEKTLPPNNEMVLIETHSPVYPVLVGKESNPVFRINVQPKTHDRHEVNELIIDLKGTSELANIRKVSVFYSSDREEFATEHMFSQTSEIYEHMTLKGRQMLTDSSNYFWLSLAIDEKTDLDNKLGAAITEVVIDKMNIKTGAADNNMRKRVGYALRKHNDDGVDTYRIPGLATTNEGTLIGVYDIRYNSSVDLQEDVDVGMNRSTDGGQSWEPMKVIMDMGEWGGLPQRENGIGDPSILVDRTTNTIWVAAVWAHGHPGKRNWFASKQGLEPSETSQFILVKSEDDGLTWSDPINITTQIKDPKWHLLLEGPGKGITMDDGTLVFPAQFKDENEIPHSTIIYSRDKGVTWEIGTGAKSKTTESQVVELADHSLMLNMRDDRGRDGKGVRSVAITKDMGMTWTEHPTSREALIEPVCMASLIKHEHHGDELFLFSNPADQRVRQNMTIKVSKDEGMTWDEKLHLLIDEGRGRGYSCMTSIDENTIGILYEGSQADMVFQRINISSIYTEK